MAWVASLLVRTRAAGREASGQVRDGRTRRRGRQPRETPPKEKIYTNREKKNGAKGLFAHDTMQRTRVSARDEAPARAARCKRLGTNKEKKKN